MIIRFNEDGTVDKVKPPPNPPDPTVNDDDGSDGDPNATGDGTEGDPNADPNATGTPQDDGSGDPNAAGDGTEGDPNADPNATGDDNVMPPPEAEPNESEKLKQSEQDMFKDFTPQQIAIMNKELKYQYKNLHLIILKTIDKLNKVSHTTYDENLLKFISDKLLKLRILVRDSLSDTFETRTYLENKRELLRFYYIFNNVGKLINSIYQSRYKRRETIDKMNMKQNRINKRAIEFPFSYSRGYDIQ